MNCRCNTFLWLCTWLCVVVHKHMVDNLLNNASPNFFVTLRKSLILSPFGNNSNFGVKCISAVRDFQVINSTFLYFSHYTLFLDCVWWRCRTYLSWIKHYKNPESALGIIICSKTWIDWWSFKRPSCFVEFAPT